MNISFTITLKDEKVLILLKQLVKLDLIKLVPNAYKKSKEKLSFDKYSGILSKKLGKEMKEEIKKGREEWGRRITY